LKTSSSNNHEGNSGFLEKLKAKWGLESIFQVIIILLVFSITGTTVVFLRKTLFNFLGFTEQTSMWLKTVTYIVFVFPAYQVLILVYGAIFGQFHFFWEKEKKLARWFMKLFKNRRP